MVEPELALVPSPASGPIYLGESISLGLSVFDPSFVLDDRSGFRLDIGGIITGFEKYYEAGQWKYRTSWTPLEAGPISFFAQGTTYSVGTESRTVASTPLSVTVVTPPPPVIALVSPADGAVFPPDGSIRLAAAYTTTPGLERSACRLSRQWLAGRSDRRRRKKHCLGASGQGGVFRDRSRD